MKNSDRNDNEKNINNQYDKYESFFKDLKLDNLEVQAKLLEINALIDHIDNRIHYTETRITRTVTFAVTLIGIGMALIAAVIQLKGISFCGGLITAILFILTGGIITLIHALQINPKYPFRALFNDWKWFYPKIVDERYKPEAFVLESNKKYLEKRLLHVKGLKSYAEKMINENPSDRLKIDIQQLYLLHVNEKYKNVFLKNLRTIMTGGLFITFIVIIVFLFLLYQEKTNKSQDQIKEWDKSAITATFDHMQFSQDLKTLFFYYILTNNTKYDYVLRKSEDIFIMAMHENSKTFDEMRVTISSDYPILLPPKHMLLFTISYKYSQTIKRFYIERPKTNPKEFVKNEFPKLRGFVIFDSKNRYQIVLPKGW